MMLALAICHHLQGDYAGARAQCERALALSQASEELTADLLDVLGSSERDQGEIKSARISYGRSLEIRQRLFGDESAQVATTLSNLGVVEHRAGRNAEAIDLISPAILILIKEHGEVHPEAGNNTPSALCMRIWTERICSIVHSGIGVPTRTAHPAMS
jgi:tetratricopeptide (TPR) repeat protein